MNCFSLPFHIKSIKQKAFYLNKKLKNVQIPENSELISIGSEAFNGSLIERIVMPVNLKFIGKMAFFNCLRLKSIEFLGDDLVIENEAFGHCKNLLILAFPNAKKVSFQKNEFFSNECSLFLVPNANIILCKL